MPADIATAQSVANALRDASQLPSLSGSQVQQIVANAGAGTAAGSQLAGNVASIYTAARANGASTSTTLNAIAAGLTQNPAPAAK